MVVFVNISCKYQVYDNVKNEFQLLLGTGLCTR